MQQPHKASTIDFNVCACRWAGIWKTDVRQYIRQPDYWQTLC